MAVLTAGTAFAPFVSQWKSNGVLVVRFFGAGVTITPLAVAVSASRHVIVAGRVTFEGAGGLDICSDANVIDQIEFVTRGTCNLPVGLETNTGEALQITNANAQTVRGWVAYATLIDGQPCPLFG